MGPEITAAIAALVSLGTFIVGYLGLRSKASSGFVDTISERLKMVEAALVGCEERERDLAKDLVAAYRMTAEEVRRGAVLETEANILRRELLALRKCALARKGECPTGEP